MGTSARCTAIGLAKTAADTDITGRRSAMGHQIPPRLLVDILEAEHNLAPLAGLAAAAADGDDLDTAIRSAAQPSLAGMADLGLAHLSNMDHPLLLGNAIGQGEFDKYTKIHELLDSTTVDLMDFRRAAAAAGRTSTLGGRLAVTIAISLLGLISSHPRR